MPAGRLGVFGGNAWVFPLSHAVNVRSLRCWAKPSAPPLTVSELRRCRDTLRELVKTYRIANATPQPTATVRRQILKNIKLAARRFLEIPKKSWAGRLLDYLDEADVNTRSILYREIASRGYKPNALISMRRELRDLFSHSIYPGEPLPKGCALSRASMDQIMAFMTGGLQVVQVLANIEVNLLVPGSGRWPDPALANLVVGLEPIWRRVTGRTAALVSKNKEGDKVCPYANWLHELLGKIGLRGPPVKLVVDVVRPRKQSKSKKTRTRHSPKIGD